MSFALDFTTRAWRAIADSTPGPAFPRWAGSCVAVALRTVAPVLTVAAVGISAGMYAPSFYVTVTESKYLLFGNLIDRQGITQSVWRYFVEHNETHWEDELILKLPERRSWATLEALHVNSNERILVLLGGSTTASTGVPWIKNITDGQSEAWRPLITMSAEGSRTQRCCHDSALIPAEDAGGGGDGIVIYGGLTVPSDATSCRNDVWLFRLASNGVV